MNYPVAGYGNPMMQRMVRAHVDSNGNTHGATRDAQARLDARTGQFDHWSSAKANAGEAAWDGISAAASLIPFAGGIPNFIRGIGKSLWGLATGKGYLVSEGIRNIGKGVLYSIPGLGTLAAGVNCAKNSFDTVAHAGFAATDLVRFGGNEEKHRFLQHMAQRNMGYGAGLASPYAQVASPGYW